MRLKRTHTSDCHQCKMNWWQCKLVNSVWFWHENCFCISRWCWHLAWRFMLSCGLKVELFPKLDQLSRLHGDSSDKTLVMLSGWRTQEALNTYLCKSTWLKECSGKATWWELYWMTTLWCHTLPRFWSKWMKMTKKVSMVLIWDFRSLKMHSKYYKMI